MGGQITPDADRALRVQAGKTPARSIYQLFYLSAKLKGAGQVGVHLDKIADISGEEKKEDQPDSVTLIETPINNQQENNQEINLA